jgi:hypothetical protein
MLINRRDTVKRTSDVALATRVLNSGGRAARLIKRGKPAAGHRSDPEWRPEEELDDYDEDETGPVVVTTKPARGRTVAAVTHVAPVAAEDEGYLDVDVVEMDSGALPVATAPAAERGATAPAAEQVEELPLEFADDEPVAHEAAAAESHSDEMPAAAAEEDGTDDEYEYVDDTSGLEAEADPPTTAMPAAASRARRFESKTAAAVSARKFEFRKRMLLTMAVLLLGSALAAYLWSTTMWYVCATVGAITLLYLAYLRRQTRIEERLRRRRLQRMARSRLGVENTVDHELNVVPARLRRPGAAVLEIDDEDPVFEHLDYVPFTREYDLPRAAGQ